MEDNEFPVDKDSALSDNSTRYIADSDFLSDLAAANRFKTFLLGRGRAVTQETSVGIAKLVAEFSEDLDWHERHVRGQNRLPSRLRQIFCWRA